MKEFQMIFFDGIKIIDGVEYITALDAKVREDEMILAISNDPASFLQAKGYRATADLIYKKSGIEELKIGNKLLYKTFSGTIEIDLEDEILHGSIENIDKIITYAGHSINELKRAFEVAVDVYIEDLKEVKL